MVNRKFNGKDIGDSAVAFFDKLAKLESSDDYQKDKNELGDSYIGRYQLGTDVLQDFGWIKKSQNKVKWSNAIFIGEAVSKWKIRNRNDFLNNPAAQDEAIMKSVIERWKVLKKHKEKICSKILVPEDAVYKSPNKNKASEEKVKSVLSKKKKQGYKTEDLKGKKLF